MKIVIASSNRAKIHEIEQICASMPIGFLSLSTFSNPPRIIEDGKTFEENAIKKAIRISEFTGLWSLADDSGIEVDALNSAPGIFSSRYAGENATDEENNTKLLRELAKVPLEKRNARYMAVVALASPEKIEAVTEGVCEGIIGFAPRGTSGFGYDPLFIVPEYGKTMAELGLEIKNKISHRAKAVLKMMEILKASIIK